MSNNIPGYARGTASSPRSHRTAQPLDANEPTFDPTAVYLDKWPVHLAPLWIDAATSRPSRYVVDFIHVSNFTTLSYYTVPVKRTGIPAELVVDTEDISETQRYEGARAGDLNVKLAKKSASMKKNNNGSSAKQKQKTVLCDAYEFFPNREGTIGLVGSYLQREDPGVYAICVPNHRFFVKPHTPHQEETFVNEIQRAMICAAMPFYDSPMVFVRAKFEIFNVPTAHAKQQAASRIPQAATKTTVSSGATTQSDSGNKQDAQPSNNDGDDTIEEVDCRKEHAHLRGCYVTIREGVLDTSKIALQEIERQQHADPKSGNNALSSPTDGSPSDGPNGSGGGPENPGQQKMLTFYHEFPKGRTRNAAVFVVPFDLASNQSLTFGLEHTHLGRLFAMPSKGNTMVPLAHLFGLHHGKSRPFSVTLTDSTSTKPRGRAHIWWQPAIHPHLQVRFTATNLFRRNFVFTDPYAVVKLVADKGSSAPAGHRKSEVIHRTEVYKNLNNATFLPVNLSLPPTMTDPECVLSPMAHVNKLSVFNLKAQLQTLEEKQAAATPKGPAGGTSSAAVPARPPTRTSALDKFVGSAQRRMSGPQVTGAVRRPQSAPVTREAKPSASASEQQQQQQQYATVAHTSNLFASTVLPAVMMTPAEAMLKNRLTTKMPTTFFDNKQEWPVVLLDDTIECDLLDAEHDPNTDECHPRVMGTFGFGIPDLIRNPNTYGANQLALNPDGTAREPESVSRAQSPMSNMSDGERRSPSPTGRKRSVKHVIPVHRNTLYDDSSKSLSSKKYRVTRNDIQSFAACVFQQPNSTATSIRSRLGMSNTSNTRVAKPSNVEITDVRLGRRFAFQDFIASGWELSSYLVADFTGGSAASHRTQVMSNGWNVHQTIIAAVNKILVPFMSRGGSDLYSAGVTTDHQFTVRPLHSYQEVFGSPVDEIRHSKAQAKKAATAGIPPVLATSTSLDLDDLGSSLSNGNISPRSPTLEPGLRSPKGALPRGESAKPFSSVRDWNGERSMMYYEAHRTYCGRMVGVNASPFFFTPVIRRMMLRCEAVQSVRSGLADMLSEDFPMSLFHVVTIIVASDDLPDIDAAVDLLSRAARKPILFLMLFLESSAPSAFAGLPNVITIDFYASEGFRQLHESLYMLERAMSRIPSHFLAYARLNNIMPDVADLAMKEDDSDFEEERDLKSTPSPAKAEPKTEGQVRADFDTAADRFNVAFNFPRRPQSARAPPKGGDNTSDPRRLTLRVNDDNDDVASHQLSRSPETVPLSKPKRFFTDEKRISVHESNQHSVNTTRPPSEHGSDNNAANPAAGLSDAQMTVVDLFMSEEEMVRQEAERKRRERVQAAVFANVVDDTLVKKHLDAISKSEAKSRVVHHNDDSLAESGELNDDDMNLQLLSREKDKNASIYQFEVQPSAEDRAMSLAAMKRKEAKAIADQQQNLYSSRRGSVAASPNRGVVSAASGRAGTAARSTSSGGGAAGGDHSDPVQRAMRRLALKGSNNLKELSEKFHFVVPEPPKLTHDTRIRHYKTMTPRKWRASAHDLRMKGAIEAQQRRYHQEQKPQTEDVVFHGLSAQKAAKLQFYMSSPKSITGGPKMDVLQVQQQARHREQLESRRAMQRQIDGIEAQHRSEMMARMAKSARVTTQRNQSVSSSVPPSKPTSMRRPSTARVQSSKAFDPR